MRAECVSELVDRHLLRVRERVGARLQPAFDTLMRRHGWLGSDPDYYLGVNSQPVLVLPLWLAAAAPPPADVLESILAASWLGYAAVRVQDDWMDEALGEVAEVMLLAQAFAAAHQAELARAVGRHDAFWTLFADVWGEYGDAMLQEVEVLKRASLYGPAEYTSVLRRSRPLVLPGAALLVAAGRFEELPALERLVRHAVRAAQTFNDVLDAREDLRGNRHTWIVRRFGGLDGEGTLMRRLIIEGGLDEVFAESRADLEAAAAAADELGCTEARPWFEARITMMEAARTAALTHLFAHLLGGASDEPHAAAPSLT